MVADFNITEENLDSRIPCNEILHKLADPANEFISLLSDAKHRDLKKQAEESVLFDDHLLPIQVQKKYEWEIRLLEEIAESESKIWLSGDAGTGKTTFLKRSYFGHKDSIYIDLKSYAGQSLEKFILETIGFSDFKWAIKDLLRAGKFNIYLDGFDEVTDGSLRLRLVKQLDNLKGLENNRFIVSSRPEIDTPKLTDFEVYDVQPVQLDDLKNYLVAKGRSELFELIKEDENLLDFCRYPLLLSFVMDIDKKDYKKFDFGNRALLYKVVVNKRFLAREALKIAERNGDDSPKDFSDELEVMEEIAYILEKPKEMVIKKDWHGKVYDKFFAEVTGHSIRPLLQKKFSDWPLDEILNSIDESGLCRVLGEKTRNFHHPTIKKSTASEYVEVNFMHKTLQEYFCAGWFARRLKKDGLSAQEVFEKYLDDDEDFKFYRHKEVLLFLSEMLDTKELNDLCDFVAGEYKDDIDFSFASELVRHSKSEVNTKKFIRAIESILDKGDVHPGLVQAALNIASKDDNAGDLIERMVGILIENEEYHRLYEYKGGWGYYQKFPDGSEIFYDKLTPIIPIMSLDDLDLKHKKHKVHSMNDVNFNKFKLDDEFVLMLWNLGTDKALAFLDKIMPNKESPYCDYVSEKAFELLASYGNKDAEAALNGQLDDKINLFTDENNPHYFDSMVKDTHETTSILLLSVEKRRTCQKKAFDFIAGYLKDYKSRARDILIEYLGVINYFPLLKEIVEDDKDPHRDIAFQTILMMSGHKEALDFAGEYIMRGNSPYRVDMGVRNLIMRPPKFVSEEDREILRAHNSNRVHYFRSLQIDSNIDEPKILKELVMESVHGESNRPEIVELIIDLIKDKDFRHRELLIREAKFNPYSDILLRCMIDRSDSHAHVAFKTYHGIDPDRVW